jgi:hypothetical protein
VRQPPLTDLARSALTPLVSYLGLYLPILSFLYRQSSTSPAGQCRWLLGRLDVLCSSRSYTRLAPATTEVLHFERTRPGFAASLSRPFACAVTDGHRVRPVPALPTSSSQSHAFLVLFRPLDHDTDRLGSHLIINAMRERIGCLELVVPRALGALISVGWAGHRLLYRDCRLLSRSAAPA